eukprot:1487929-Prymnesium_polylepis.2
MLMTARAGDEHVAQPGVLAAGSCGRAGWRYVRERERQGVFVTRRGHVPAHSHRIKISSHSAISWPAAGLQPLWRALCCSPQSSHGKVEPENLSRCGTALVRS